MSVVLPVGSVVLIGASAGGLETVGRILSQLRSDLDFPIIIVLHRGKEAASDPVAFLQQQSRLPVKEADEKEWPEHAHVYIAPADYHLLIERGGAFALDCSEKVNHSRPSIDVLFESCARVHGPRAVAILLTGSNTDGTEGLMAVQRAQGLTLVQDPETAIAPMMPRNAIKKKCVDRILTIEQIIDALNAREC